MVISSLLHIADNKDLTLGLDEKENIQKITSIMLA